MNPTQVREFMEESRQTKLIYGPRKEIKKDADKFAIIEFYNLNEEFLQKMMLMNSIYYANSRLNTSTFSNDEKDVIRRFLDDTYGVKENHLGAIGDLMVDSTVRIPEVPEALAACIAQTSFEQVEAVNDFYLHNYDNLRIAVKAGFGLDPSFECSMYLHGLFTEKEMERYRMDEVQNISDEAIAIPVGRKVLLQSFIEQKERTVIYNPYDPSVERLSKSRKFRLDGIQRSIYKRIKNDALEDIHPDIMEKIQTYRAAIDNLGDDSSDDTVAEKSRILEEMLQHVDLVAKEDQKLVTIKTADGDKTILMTDSEIKEFQQQ
jgi:hypothetical protein